MNIKKIANVLGLVLLIALVIPFVVYAVPGVVGADGSFIVLSGSMEPQISPGDTVIVTETDPADITVGDVITFVRSDGDLPVTHRVVGIEESSSGYRFETKGDANSDADANPVAGANVIGVVTITIPYIGYVVQAGNSTTGFVLLVAIPLGLLVVTELWSLVKASRSAGAGKTESDVDAAATGDEASSDTDASSAATTDETGRTDDTGGQAEITLSPDELGLSALILALVAPYTVYVAFELGTALSVSVAFGAVLSLLATGTLWLTAWLSARRASGPAPAESDAEPIEELDPATDGGITDEGER
jgi:signal peptidase